MIVNLPFKNGSLRLITWVESRALFLLYKGNPIEGTYPLKDEQLSHYEKKAAVMERYHHQRQTNCYSTF